MLEEVLNSLDKSVVTDVRVYEMKNRTPFYDYAVICSANSSRQGMAAANYLKDDAGKFGWNVRGISASDGSNWFLVDLDEVVVHIFVGNDRAYYNLDEMYNN